MYAQVLTSPHLHLCVLVLSVPAPGSTKVFLKSHQAATLARLHTAALAAAATRIQAEWRAAQARAHYKAVRVAVVRLQAGARGMAARRLAERLRREKAATALQVCRHMREGSTPDMLGVTAVGHGWCK